MTIPKQIFYRLIFESLGARPCPPNAQNLKERWKLSVQLEGGDLYPLEGTFSDAMFSGARRLLELGAPENSLITSRSAKSQCDSFNPMKIKDAAKLSVSEGDKSVQITRYQKFDARDAFGDGEAA